ncbi:glycosyltransferase [Flaviaesturariibacter aridisoli]|uniref:Glycosyltransferase n=1 Tax=Flaviaesturariibacter aridisoli TaxID=2545761 RepID=A0A4R4E155_9BACT|nr:glycosyltransferase [Flaviaesturariibacter aridisoli]TCZ73129.1 glycosyltransferase [Flaviaesturariibacter aridisoli]
MSQKKGLLIFPILKDLNAADGILVKNAGIQKGFEENNIPVDVLEFNSQGVFNGSEKVYSFSTGRYGRIYQFYVSAWNAIARYVAKKRYDFIWFRVPLLTPFIADFVAYVRKQLPDCQIILEYGGYPYENELQGFRKKFYLMNKRFEKKLHGNADFIITYLGQESVDGLPNIPIGNGIDIDKIRMVQGQPPLNEGIQMISVSSLKKWHAYDRIIEGMATYVRRPDAKKIVFHVIGMGPEYERLTGLVAQHQLQDYVIFHGNKIESELDTLYDQGHVAICTMGFHRVGVSTSSSLKNREYFARGLPIVVSIPDEDMPVDLPSVLEVPADESPVDIEAIVRFTEKVYEDPNAGRNIRAWAEDKVTWKSKVRTVLEFLEKHKRPVAINS